MHGFIFMICDETKPVLDGMVERCVIMHCIELAIKVTALNVSHKQ